VGLSLVAFDTDHIKGYVFGTDKLKEIRGASSLLDRLNRVTMTDLAQKYEAIKVYANGGSGLFVVNSARADLFGKSVQGEFRQQTAGSASVTFVVQQLPEKIKTPDDIWKTDVKDELELLRYRLREAKSCPPNISVFSSHPFLRPCTACGIEYAAGKDKAGDPNEQDARYCASCLKKRQEDLSVRDCIENCIEHVESTGTISPLWDTVIKVLRNINYRLPYGTMRPGDFNVFGNFQGSKDYIGLIYADANGMGKKLEGLSTLLEVQKYAYRVDDAIYRATCDAIEKHLQIGQHTKPDSILQGPIFPFDILLLGGDDVVMVVPAAVAMDVALTIATQFHERTEKEHTLSVGVVLAPIKYPFRLTRELVESTLKFAKREGADPSKHTTDFRDTRINFMTVTGSTSHEFQKVYSSLSKKDEQVSGHKNNVSFYATLRPYDPEQLTVLLSAIRDGHRENLGRTKLHQVREAVLKMNLTTSVMEGLAVLRNWRQKQRAYVLQHVYGFGGRYQMQYSDPQNLASQFPRVTFPWFADGSDTYRTSLLDFVELYDFVAREEGSSGDEN